MLSTPRPHDLVWLNSAAALEAIEEHWVSALAHQPAGGGTTRR